MPAKTPRLALFTVLLLLPAFAAAEGAVRVLACKTMQRCDANGACQPQAGDIEFRLSPVTLQPDGGGQYRLRYGNDEVAMQAQSEAGPFLWTTKDGERHTLLASSETRFLWHRLRLQPQPAATIDFLACTFRQ